MTVETYTPQPLLITDAARQQYRNLVTPTEQYLRLGLKGGGCSGFEIFFRLDTREDLADDDTVVEIDSGGIVVDQISLSYLRGSTVDYKIDLGGSRFDIQSPLATGTCGCGSSLSF